MSRTRKVLVGVVVGVLVAIALGVLIASGTPTYRSTALLSIDEPQALAASDDAGVIDKLSRLRAKYVGLVGTTRITEPVASALGVDAGSLHLAATATPDDLLIHVSATSSDRAQAHRVADALAAALVTYVQNEQQSESIAAPRQVQLAVVEPADAGIKVDPQGARIVGGAALGGGAAGLLAAGLVAALTGSRRRPPAVAPAGS